MSRKRNPRSTRKKSAARAKRRKASPRTEAAPRAGVFRFFRLFLFFLSGFLAAGAVCFALNRRAPERSSPFPENSAAGKVKTGSSPAVKLLLDRGAGHFAAERYADSFREFRKASRLAPLDPRPHYAIGDVYRVLDRYELAEKSYRKALECDPDYLPAKIKLAHVLCLLGGNDEAERLLAEARRKAPANPALWAASAENAFYRGEFEEAVKWLRKYNAARGRQVWGYAHLGRAYARMDKREEAEKSYREAIAVDPATTQAYLWLGELLMASGRKIEAERVLEIFKRNHQTRTRIHRLERTLMARPDSVGALYELARARYAIGKKKTAVLLLERALRLAPSSKEIRSFYNKVRHEIEETDKRNQP